eukprot:TRINITY_DN6651_c0_g1_i1.p1 TRINITY_DN6651_c0_g1~~TRINITY_DN6651_c0_g1_i1.p1  ORF type:complete len:192 (-),score=41.37 TRINITY_DN6651_c0_g1_i1:2-577(-)
MDNESDKQIRQKVMKKDLERVQKVKSELEEEEKELKEFFNTLSEPKAEDPTLIRKKRYQEKMEAYRQVMEGLDFKNLMRSFFSYKPATPEEVETLDDCRRYTKRNFFLYAGGGITFTSGLSFYYRRELPRYMKLMGFVVGLLGGGVYGIIRSTEYTLRRFEELGPDYDLGRLAIAEIEEYRMDKNLSLIHI